MDEKERRTITFQVSVEEADILDAEARREGISRSDYLRKKLFSGAGKAPTTNTESLLHQIIYILARLHTAAFMIREREGVLSTESLEEIYEATAQAARQYLRELDERITKVREQVHQMERAA
jgi:hypothetical protein